MKLPTYESHFKDLDAAGLKAASCIEFKRLMLEGGRCALTILLDQVEAGVSFGEALLKTAIVINELERKL